MSMLDKLIKEETVFPICVIIKCHICMIITFDLYFSSFYQIKTTSHPSPAKTFDITGPLPYNPIIKGALPKTLTDWSGFYEMQLFSW